MAKSREVSNEPGAPPSGAPEWNSGGLWRPMAVYFVLPVTVKWARRFRCQQSSLDCEQAGTSLP
jgi:hypothetical protein